MQYFLTTTIINEEGEQIAILEDREISSDEVISALAKQRDDNKDPVPLKKVKKAKKVKKVKAEKTERNQSAGKSTAEQQEERLIERIQKWLGKGKDADWVAMKTGADIKKVRKFVSGKATGGGPVKTEPVTEEEATQGRKKSTERRDAIAKDLVAGMPLPDIAAKYGVSKATVYNVKKTVRMPKNSDEPENQGPPITRTSLPENPLGGKEFSEVKRQKFQDGKMVVHIAKDMEVPVREVECAIASKNYSDYLGNRKELV